MNLPDSCKELFLDGVTDIYLYQTNNLSFAIPFSVPQILSLTVDKMPSPNVHLSLADENAIIATSLSAKVSPDLNGNGIIYSYEISAVIASGIETISEIHKDIKQNDCYVVLRRDDGTLRLCYTLPNTFLFKPTESVSSSDNSTSLSVTLKAMSDFIELIYTQG